MRKFRNHEPTSNEPRVKGGPNIAFLKKHKLNENSHPLDWFNAVLPLTPDDNLEDVADIDVKGNGKSKFAISNWTAYTSSKAAICNAGEDGYIFAGKYKQSKPLTTEEYIRKMIGTRI